MDWTHRHFFLMQWHLAVRSHDTIPKIDLTLKENGDERQSRSLHWSDKGAWLIYLDSTHPYIWIINAVCITWYYLKTPASQPGKGHMCLHSPNEAHKPFIWLRLPSVSVMGDWPGVALCALALLTPLRKVQQQGELPHSLSKSQHNKGKGPDAHWPWQICVGDDPN